MNYSVAVGMITRAGISNSTTATLEAINLWHPRYIILSGIAGGLSDLDKSDSIIANTIYGYENGKISQKYEPRSIVYYSDIGLLSAATAYSIKDDWRNLIKCLPRRNAKPRWLSVRLHLVIK